MTNLTRRVGISANACLTVRPEVRKRSYAVCSSLLRPERNKFPMSEWWLSRGDGKTEGPLSTRAIVDGLVAGEIPKRSHVCAVGEQQWHLVSEIEEIWEAVDPSESRTSVTETPWFVDRTDSGKHKLEDADAGGDERTQLTSTNGSEISAGKASTGGASTGTASTAGLRPSPSKSDDVPAKMSAAQSDPERRSGGPRADGRRSIPNAISETGYLQSNLSAAPNLSARPSPDPPSPGHRTTEGSATKPAQKSTVQTRPSPAPPARSRSAESGSADSNARASHSDVGAPRATPAPASGVKPTSTPVALQPHPPHRVVSHQPPPPQRQIAPVPHDPGAAKSPNASEQVQSVASAPARPPARSQTTEAAPRPSIPGLPGPGQGTSASSLAGLTPLGLKPHDPLSSTAPLFAGLTGLSPLPGPAIASSRQQTAYDTAVPGNRVAPEPAKAPPLEPSRPSTPPATRNAYGASPLAESRPRPSAIPPERKASAALSTATTAQSSPHGSANVGLVSAPAANRPVEAASKLESAVTIQPIIALAAPPSTSKPDEQQRRVGSVQSASGHSPEGAHKPTRATPESKLSPLIQSSSGSVHAPHTLAAGQTHRATDWDEDDPTRFVARASRASAVSSIEAAPAKGEHTSSAAAITGASTAIGDQTPDTADEATTLLRTRVEPSHPRQPSLGLNAPAQVPPSEVPAENQPSSAYPRATNLRAIAEANALGPDAIVKDPAQLLEDVEDEAGPPEVPIVQLPMVAPVVAPRVGPPSSPPVAPASAPVPAQPTALTAPPSTPPPAHNPRLSVPTIVLKPEPIVHQEATQPAVRALRKRSPFRLSYGSLIGLMLAIAVICLVVYLMVL